MARGNTGSTANWLSRASVPMGGTPTFPFCYSFWFYSTGSTLCNTLVFINSAVDVYFATYLNSSGGAENAGTVELIGANVTESRVVAPGTFTNNTWNHVFVDITATNSRAIRLNNGSVATDTANVSVTGLGFFDVGAARGGGATTFGPINGRLANLGYWQGVSLNANERAALAAGISAKKVRPESQRMFIDFNAAESGSALDTHSRGLTGDNGVYDLTENGTVTQENHAPVTLNGPFGLTRHSFGEDTVAITRPTQLYGLGCKGAFSQWHPRRGRM